MFKILLPVKIKVSARSKARRLSMNSNDFMSNLIRPRMKIEAQKIFSAITKKILGNRKFKKITLTYQIYKRTAGKIDIGNYESVVDKFFCDMLVGDGYIEDDNDDYIIKKTFKQSIKSKEFDDVMCLVTIREV